jgi:hypothetical protein
VNELLPAPEIFSRDGRWLFGPRADVLLFGGSAAASLLLLALGAQLGLLHGDAPPWMWLGCVVLIDVAHVWSTTLRVYLDRSEVMRRPWLYLGLPLALYTLGVFAHAIAGRVFWTMLAYAAVFHFVRQQWGWVALYRRRAGDDNRFDDILDRVAIYSATLYPLAHWHAHQPKRFHWLIEGDFLRLGPTPELIDALAPAYWSVLAAFCTRQAWLAARGRAQPGKALLVVSTFACWYAGIIAFNSDYAFTATNVLIHGVPYFALTYRYGRARAPLGSVLLRRVIVLGAGGVLALLAVVALVEELLWDRLVWHEAAWLFGDSEEALSSMLLALIVPLLALPQATHYALDGFIWKRSDVSTALRASSTAR